MSILKSILDARSIAKPNGLPLFAYRTTDSEYSRIRNTLRELESLSTEWAALFCLFGAEHIRRNYEGGPWKWEPILDAIGYQSGLQPLYQRIERGLAYFNRPLQRSRAGERQFWLTLMCEGGIPIRVLKRDGAPLTCFLRSLLAEVERYPQLPMEDAAERIAKMHLKPSLQNEAFLDFAVYLTSALRDLRSQVSNRPRAIQELDASQPGWRARIPIGMDDESAQQLLEGLLTSPREEPEKGLRLALETVLVMSETPLLRKYVRPVTEISDSDVTRLIDEGIAPPSRLIVHLLRSESELASLGVLVRRSGGGYTFRATSTGVDIENAQHLTPIILTQGSARVGTASIPGSEALGEGIWVFAPVTDDTARLVAFGSFRAAIDRLIVAVPESASVALEAGEQRRRGVVFGRSLVEVQGRVVFTVEGKRSVIDTRHDARVRQFRLEGRLRASIFADREVFEGCPDIVEMSVDGTERIVPRSRIEVRHLGARRWLAHSAGIFGDVQIRVLDEDEVVFSTRCGVVPSDLRIVLLPSEEDQLGRIKVFSRALRTVMAASSPSYVCTTAGRDAGAHVIELRANVPVPVELSLRFEGDGELCGVVPFPAKLKAFTDRLGKPIPPNTQLSVHALAGLSARCIAPPGKMPKEVDLEARTGSGLVEYVGRLLDRPGMGKVLELEAIRDRLEQLLSSSEGDDDVYLSLAERGGVLGGKRQIRLRRYDAALIPEKFDTHELLSLQSMENAFGNFDALSVSAVPLWRPRANPEPLVRGEDGRWIFRYEGHASGPWLVTGWLGEALSVRPLRVSVPGEGSERIRPELEEIVRAPFDRRQRFANLCNELSKSWSHAEWSGFDEYLDTLGIFPSYTFEAVRAVVMAPRAAILALLRSNDATQLRRRWRVFEELPMSWFMLPMRAWLNAGIALREEASRCADSCAAAGVPGEWTVKRFVRELLAPVSDPTLPPFLSLVREMWARVLADFPDTHEGMLSGMTSRTQRELLAKTLLQGRAADLIQRHANDHWPQVHLDVSENSGRRIEGLGHRLWSNTPGFRRDVLRTPVVAAALMLENASTVEPQLVRAVRRIRAFDEEWFDETHAFALAWFVGEQLERDASYLDRIAGL